MTDLKLHRAGYDGGGPGSDTSRHRLALDRPSGQLSGGGREEDRVPVLRPLVAGAWVGHPLRPGRAPAVDRARRGRGGARSRWRLCPGPPLRPAARVAFSAARGDRRPHPPHRDRHGGHRHALREPLLHGRGRGRGGPHRRRSASARHQPRLARAGDRRLASFRLRAGRGRNRRRHGPPPRRGVPRLLEGKGFAEPNPRPMFPNPPGLLRLEPHSKGFATASGGARRPTPPPSGRRSAE